MHRLLVNRKAVISAQQLFRDDPTRWIWTLAMWEMKKAYGIYESKPLPQVGDTTGSHICVYSDTETRSHIFVDRDYL